jgi:hypothetical protein
MAKLRSSILCACITFLLFVLLSHPILGAEAKIHKSVTPTSDGKYVIKLKVTATSSSIYALKLFDQKASITDVYAPKGWCIVTDGGDFLARTFDKPILQNKFVEFIIHSSSEDIQYTWTVFGRMKQLGPPKVL